MPLGFYRVVKPLYTFKLVNVVSPVREKTLRRAIANLIIPAGAIVYADYRAFHERSDTNERKMRASKAYVYSIEPTSSSIKSKYVTAESRWDPRFKYYVGEMVEPAHQFSFAGNQCESGIHFFLNLYDAFYYQ